MTDILKPTPENISLAAKIIKDGGVVAIPTETVYGLAADATCESAVLNIFKIKGRPSDNPLIVHIADISDIDRYAQNIPDLAYDLLSEFSPGPLTIVLEKKGNIPSVTSGGLQTVAIRIPDNDIAQKIIKESGTAVAMPSANISTRPSPTNAISVYNDLCGRLPFIVDGGQTRLGIESTVISLVGDTPVLLRPGSITKNQLLKFIPTLTVSPSASGGEILGDTYSPGMKYRHYAPDTKLIMITGDVLEVSQYINNNKTSSTGVICYNNDAQLYDVAKKFKTDNLAVDLYNILREIDKHSLDVVYIKAPSLEGEELALYNRLIKASSHSNIIL